MDHQLVSMNARAVASMRDNTQVSGPFEQLARTIMGDHKLKRDDVLVAAEHKFANGSTSRVMAAGKGDQVCNAVVSSLTGTICTDEVRKINEALQNAIQRIESAEKRAADSDRRVAQVEQALMRAANENSSCQRENGELKGRINQLETLIDRLQTENAEYVSQIQYMQAELADTKRAGKRSRFEPAAPAKPDDKPAQQDEKSVLAGLLSRFGCGGK